MSSKWSKNSAVQQPPPVCHKGPDDLPVPPPPIYRRTLQAYVNVIFPGTPGGFRVAGLIQLHATTPDTTWAGITNQGTQNVECEVFSPPPYVDFNVELTALLGPAVIDQFTFFNISPQNFTPFDLGLLTEQNPPSPDIWQVSVTD